MPGMGNGWESEPSAAADYRGAVVRPALPRPRRRPGRWPTTSGAAPTTSCAELLRRRQDLARPGTGRPVGAGRPGQHPRQRAARRRQPRPGAPAGARGGPRRRLPGRSPRRWPPCSGRRRARRSTPSSTTCGPSRCCGAAPRASGSCARSPTSSPSPAGLGPRRRRPREPRRPDGPSRPLLDDAPPAARAILDRLTWGPPVAVLPPGTPERVADGARWLLERTSSSQPAADQLVLPARGRPGPARRSPARRHRPSSAPPCRGTRAHPGARSTPPPGSRSPTCSPSSTSWPPTGGCAHRGCCAPAASPSATCSRLATVLDVDEVRAGFVVELAYAAGLLADDGSLDPSWAPTPAYDDWQQLPGPPAVGGARARLAAHHPRRPPRRHHATRRLRHGQRPRAGRPLAAGARPAPRRPRRARGRGPGHRPGHAPPSRRRCAGAARAGCPARLDDVVAAVLRRGRVAGRHRPGGAVERRSGAPRPPTTSPASPPPSSRTCPNPSSTSCSRPT